MTVAARPAGERKRAERGVGREPADRIDTSPRARELRSKAKWNDAKSFEERADVCSRLRAVGQWEDGVTPKELSIAWGVSEAMIAQYTQAARYHLSTQVDTPALLARTLRRLETEEAAARTAAEELETAGQWKEAEKYRALTLKALQQYSAVAGLLTTKVSISLEADPRIAGLWSVLWEALGELDHVLAEREEVERTNAAHILTIVERINGGTVPADMSHIVGFREPVPSAVETVRAAVKKYEERIGARAKAL